MGKGAVDERHPLSLGVIGNTLGPHSPGRYLRPMIEAADVVLIVGSRTAQNGTDTWTLFPKDAQYIPHRRSIRSKSAATTRRSA